MSRVEKVNTGSVTAYERPCKNLRLTKYRITVVRATQYVTPDYVRPSDGRFVNGYTHAARYLDLITDAPGLPEGATVQSGESPIERAMRRHPVTSHKAGGWE